VNVITHALTMNGRIHGEVKDSVVSPEEVIRKTLMLLDGTDRYSLSLWRLPLGVRFDKVNLKKWPQEYIQVAGTRERMTVEVRRVEEGVARHYVVGHTASGTDSETTEVVLPWNAHEVTVFASEVFDAIEASDIFVAYYATDWVSQDYTLRKLDP